MLHGTIMLLLFMLGNRIGIFFGTMVTVTAIMGTIYVWFNAMENALMHASIHSPVHKIEDRIDFALIHACLYSAESNDERDIKHAASNTLSWSCGDRGSRSSLLAIVVSLSATSGVFCS